MNSTQNLVQSSLIQQKVTEINIAGGEPTLSPYLVELAKYIRSKGLKVSLIHNGSGSMELYREIAPYLTTCGFSIDSVDSELQRKMGRCYRDGQVITADEYAEKIRMLRSVNPNIRIKVNTVVNQVNLEDNLAPQIAAWGVDRWKFLRCMPFSDGIHDNHHMVISDSDYTAYMQRLLTQFSAEYIPEQCRYQLGKTLVVAERSLAGSYIMVDSNGCLVDDTKNTSYTKVADLRTEDFREALSRLTLYEELYRSRY
jgi:radical S-adenosyl methionine domain-containing protein 2